MSVAKGRRQFVIVDRPAALAGRRADWRETSFVAETAAFSYGVDRRALFRWDRHVPGDGATFLRAVNLELARAFTNSLGLSGKEYEG